MREALFEMGMVVDDSRVAEIDGCLESNGRSVQRAIQAWLGIAESSSILAPGNMAMEREDSSASPSAKRPRPPPKPTTPQLRQPPATSATQTPFTMAAGSSTHAAATLPDIESVDVRQTGSSLGTDAAMAVALAQLTLRFDKLAGEYRDLCESMPGRVATAVRHYDERAALKLKLDEEEKEQRTMEQRLERCITMEDISNVARLQWVAVCNELRCANCQAYARRLHLFRGGGTGDNDDEASRHPGIVKGVKAPTRRIAEVRKAVLKHLASKMHRLCQQQAQEEARVAKIKNGIGVDVGKTVLELVKEHDSDASFERRLTTLQSRSVCVGTKNHSRKFVPRLRTSMARVLYKGFGTLLTTPAAATKRFPVFALMADKATLRRRTGQMHGIIVIIGGVLTPILLSILSAVDSTGPGLADLLKEVLMGGKPLRLTDKQVRQSMTGLAFDGQYQGAHEGHASGLDVVSHLCKSLNIDARWCISRWDGAHRIEIAMANVRDVIRFYGDLAAVVSNTQQRYLYGKSYERVCMCIKSPLYELHIHIYYTYACVCITGA